MSSQSGPSSVRHTLTAMLAAVLITCSAVGVLAADVRETRPLEDNPVVALMAALPPKGHAVVFEISATVTDPDGDQVEHVAVVERNLNIIYVEYEKPSEFRGDQALIVNNAIQFRQNRGGIRNYSGTFRAFDHLPLLQFGQVLFLGPSRDYVGKQLYDEVLNRETVRVLKMVEASTSNIFEWIKIYYHEEGKIPIRAVFHSEDHIHTLTADYTFGHQVTGKHGSQRFVSRIVILEEPEGIRFDLRIGEPLLIEQWHVTDMLH